MTNYEDPAMSLRRFVKRGCANQIMVKFKRISSIIFYFNLEGLTLDSNISILDVRWDAVENQSVSTIGTVPPVTTNERYIDGTAKVL